MAKKLETKTKKYTVRLTDGAPEELEAYYPDAGGYNAILRALLDNHIKKCRERLNRKLSAKKELQDDKPHTTDLELDGLEDQSAGDSGPEEH